MLDIRFIRENPDIVKDNIKKKFQDKKLPLVDELLEKDKLWRNLKSEIDELRAKRNKLSLEINEAKKKKKENDIKKILKEAKDIPEKIEELEKKKRIIYSRVLEIQKIIPNIIHKSVPIGKDASENVEIKKIGTPKKIKFEIKNHAELIENLGYADFDASARTSGKGFYYLSGPVALLNQALTRFAIDFMLKKKYTYVEPPLLIRKNIVEGVMSFEEMENMMYKIENDDLYLIGTSEHSLIGKFIDQAIPEENLPIKLVSYSMCFRKEIGSHGIDEKGLYRTHQFNKVEQIIVCKPEDSYKFYEEILNNSVELFKKLGIPVRILEMCSGDLADLKAKSADVEAWSPRQKIYFEVCSCSNLTDAQARRLNIRAVKKGGEKYFVHTLNDTAIATSRALVAILENCQEKDGSIKIPRVLVPYMNGLKKIENKKKKKNSSK